MMQCDLPYTWRRQAEQLRRFGADQAANALEVVAGDLTEWLSELSDETLSLKEAAAESGYTADHLGRLIREGKIRNAGRPNAPRIRRADLPRKAGTLRRHPEALHGDGAKAAIVRSVIEEGA